MKQCLKRLKQYCNYTNEAIITKYPKLISITTYDKYFPTFDIKPSKSQVQLIQTIKSAFSYKYLIETPLLILYKPMIGSRETTASITTAISNLVKDLKISNDKN